VLFNTPAYAVFFGVVFLVAWLLASHRRLRLLFLLAASYFFYAQWDWRFLPLIWGSSTADWLLGNAIARASTPRSRKLWLAGTVVLNLGVLGVFKYFDFGIASARAMLASFGYPTILKMKPSIVARRVAKLRKHNLTYSGHPLGQMMTISLNRCSRICEAAQTSQTYHIYQTNQNLKPQSTPLLNQTCRKYQTRLPNR
jgi:hypothetical protein